MRNIQSYTIDSLDLLAQGVAKDDAGKTVFIPKALPGETVKAEIIKERKNSKHANLLEIEVPSPERIAASCPHFDDCPACHYLHTDYEHEIVYKQKALMHQLGFLYQQKSLKTPEIEVFSAPKRSHYRNRVQLHYRHKYLGYIHAQSDQVLEVPNCQIIRPELQASFDQLYQKDWVKTHSGKGHVELYLKDGEVTQNWDSDYAQGGFSQVNEAVNASMCEQVNAQLATCAPELLLDLFSGKGNLSNAYTESSGCKRIMADISPYSHPDYMQVNLFDDDSLERFIRRFNKADVDTLLIDPPRAGFAHLDVWLKKLKPKHLIYVSCNPLSLSQDLRKVVQGGCKLTIEQVQLFDMFPGTNHFETLVSVKFKKHAK